jgi:D-3-phosphoglycerate dehydrogenase
MLRGRRIVVLATQCSTPRPRALPDPPHIVFLGTGASSYVDLAAAAARGVAVHVVPGYGNRAVAEHALALILACARRVAANGSRGSRRRISLDRGVELAGATLGVVAPTDRRPRWRASAPRWT